MYNSVGISSLGYYEGALIAIRCGLNTGWDESNTIVLVHGVSHVASLGISCGLIGME